MNSTHKFLLNTNKSIYDYNISTQQELVAFCKPLKDYFGLTFGYMRIYKNNRYFLLHEDIDLVKQYVFSLDSATVFYDQYIGNLKNKHNFKYTLWPETPTGHPSMNLFFDTGFWNGMDICLKTEDYLDVWWFSRKKSDINYTSNRDFFIKNTDVLTEFVIYFNQCASRFITSFDKNKLASFLNGFDANVLETKPQEFDKITSFLNIITNEKLKFNTSKTIIKLSSRELECLQQLSLGMTIKQVARILKISPRTVDTHISHIKTKSGLHYKQDLIMLMRESNK